jgi:hypothetical protein
MKRILILPGFILLYSYLYGQTPVGTWTDHLIYNTANRVAVTTKEVFASTGSSILVFNKEYSELKKMSRINGLSETGIRTIDWSEENKTLIIAYTSTNIDLLINNEIYNIPDINRKYIPGLKEINRIRTKGRFAYLACSFGIVLVDITKKEIYDTWKPGTGTENAEVFDIAFSSSKVYAATGKGLFSADLNNPGLSYFGNWKLISNPPNTTAKYTSLVFAGNKLYANLTDPASGGDTVYVIEETSSLFSYVPGIINTSFDLSTGGFTITSPSRIRYFNNEGINVRTLTSFSWGTPNISQAIVADNDIWIADINYGLIKGENMSAYTILTLPGPASNNAYNITSNNGKTIICAGGADVSWNNQGRPFQISANGNNKWETYTSANINDAMRSIIDPEDNMHIFVSSWGGGLLEFKDNNLINQFTESNSPLQTIIPGKAYVRVCGLAIDESNYLWLTQTEVPGSIKALKPDGKWIVNPITIDAPSIGDIIISKSGFKWIILPRGRGLFILDDNKTPELFSDDKYRYLLPEDTENQIISNIYSIAEDLNGYIWLGTDQGPIVYYNPEKIFDNKQKANRIKIPRNDGSGFYDYLLKSEAITSISVDGANRKWLGTSGSGLYNVSADGTTLIKYFNEQNSPILSNSIVSLAVDNKSGEIWIGTSKGIQSFRGNATKGEVMFSNVYAFPNPVREDFTGNITISGLMRDTEIKITDISGNLVYETVSDGGMATWDLKTYNGKTVTTGVYLVFCSSSDGSQSIVTKILVIR